MYPFRIFLKRSLSDLPPPLINFTISPSDRMLGLLVFAQAIAMVMASPLDQLVPRACVADNCLRGKSHMLRAGIQGNYSIAN